MKRVILILGVIIALFAMGMPGNARAVQFGPIFVGTPLWGIDDPSNAGMNGDILKLDSTSLQGAQWSWDQSTYNNGHGTWYELVLKNDGNGKMCIDDRGGLSGGSIAIKLCNDSASQAWFSTCYIAVQQDGSILGLETLVDARGKNIRANNANTAPLLGVLVNWIGDDYDQFNGPVGIPEYNQGCA